jgi:hypothetical protein
MRIRSIAAVLGVATALAGAQTATAENVDDGPAHNPSSDTPCLTIDLRQAEPDNPACGDLPRFKAAFLNRVWRFNGSVDGVEHDELSMTLDSIDRLPARFRNQDDELLDQDTTVLFSHGTRVYGPDGRLVEPHNLEIAEDVQVRGRLLSPRKWRANDDGDVVPTVRAKRIHVNAWVAGAEPTEADDHDDSECDGGAYARTGAEHDDGCS